MNYPFKIIAVVLALGVLVLQGCQTIAAKHKIGQVSSINNSKICSYSSKDGEWRTEGYSQKFVKEAKRRGLDCGVKDKKTIIASKKKQKSNIDIQTIACALMPSGHCRFLKKSNEELCEYIIGYRRGVTSIDNYSGSFNEAKRRGLTCGGTSKNKTVTASKPKTQTYTKPITSSAELDAERKKGIELERKLAAMEAKQKQEQQRIDTDTRVPLIEIISNKTEGKRGTITGIARDNVQVAEVTVDGQTVKLNSNGKFKYSTFVPSDGITLNVQVTDVAGLTSSRSVALQRNDSIASTSITFDRLNPLGKSVRINSNALALIVGVEGYKNTNADALYADKDAKMFRDFASEKLGIPENRIRVLLNDNAGRIDITRAIKTWLLKRTVTNKTDIYVFFAGHGLATDDGKGMYLLPYDGVLDLLEDSAIQRKELFADIQATKPRSVTLFLDTCYSGGTRNEEETLVASLRPIIITAKQQLVPDNFTVISAAKGNQTSQSLEEAKHGLFSYYMMLGMEGGADLNADKKITARELHSFVLDKVERQSQFRQTPELQGDKDRVLVQFN